MAVKKKIPWRDKILQSLPSTPGVQRVMTYPELDAALVEAAGTRRMRPEEYAMRAVRAFVEHDLDLDNELCEPEPLLHDTRRGTLPPMRYRGKEFGRWRIERLAE